jgi:Protein of unknown function (DUF2510)
MGFLKDMMSGSGGAASLSRSYLQAVPTAPNGKPIGRKTGLYNDCFDDIAALPVAAAERFGRPVTDIFELGPATDVVRSVMEDDKAMHAWVAREGLVMLDVLLENMPGRWDENLEVAMASVGLVAGPVLRDDLVAEMPSEVQERAVGLASATLQMFWVVARPQADRAIDRRYYEHAFSSSDGRTRETVYDITAWTAVVMARLIHSRRAPALPIFGLGNGGMPVMTEAGWYPNPYNFGEVAGGDATFQRFWDGADWTDRIRLKSGGRWNEQRHSLRTPPEN